MNPILHSPLNLRYIEKLYDRYRRDPSSVDGAWRAYFAELRAAQPASGDGQGAAFTSRSDDGSPNLAPTIQEQLNDLVRGFRTLGHRAAHIDPLGDQKSLDAVLEPAAYGLTAERMRQLFPCAGLHWPGPLPLRDIIERLRRAYCGSVGYEYMHIEDGNVRAWLQERIESDRRLEPSPEQRRRILTDLIQAALFEEFTRSQFVGAKSFSLEGSESLIPLLHFVIERAARGGVREVVLGMAHRGRLNVLVNVMGKKHREVFREFIDRPENDGGDVKYHLGYSRDLPTGDGRAVHLSLCFNPSHLEFVSPVALGRVRAKQDRFGDKSRTRAIALLMHGDAAFVGEGIVQETLNLSGLPGYTVGGALHIIINNQIGFTTVPGEARSSRYASDVGKMLHIPIFHVNADDPEAVLQATALALEFRGSFARDVIIDLVGYRRHGHNEGDEPGFTQPQLYRKIGRHPPVQQIYLERLFSENIVTRAEADRIAGDYRKTLDAELASARAKGDSVGGAAPFGGVWSGYRGGLADNAEEIETAVPESRLQGLLETQARLPLEFHPHPKIARAAALRMDMAAGKRPLDWAAAEALAFASLAIEGTRVRLTGQDTARGTFSQRHAVLHDVENGRRYVPLQHLADGQAPVEVYNSPLSEAGVLGFEYGYSLDYPDALVLWEAQFGDFVNAAQVIVDQFIASAEEKWRRLSGLVLLLPHGFEGMGPEHSSARLERFLQLCARDNLQVIYPTTPAQYFHALRRQALRRWRKPLVIMTPKSLLRHRESVSPLSALAHGAFASVIAEDNRSTAKRLLLCSGKIYYDLKHYRAETHREDVALVRIEQLYPVPHETLAAALEPYADGTPAVWVQEEPVNMGAACFWTLCFGTKLFDRLPFSVVARPASASPATGSIARHKQQQADLVAAAFAETG